MCKLDKEAKLRDEKQIVHKEVQKMIDCETNVEAAN